MSALEPVACQSSSVHFPCSTIYWVILSLYIYKYFVIKINVLSSALDIAYTSVAMLCECIDIDWRPQTIEIGGTRPSATHEKPVL